MTYKIDDNLAALHRKLTKQEFEQLEENCIKDGRILDPVIVWNGYILDGIHRMKIAETHGLEYSVAEIDLDSMDDARSWVIYHQLGKRNISDFEATRLRAELAKMLDDTAEAAEIHGVSRRTVQRDVEAMEARSLMSEDIREKCDDGSIINYRADWKRYADLTEPQRKAVDDTLRRNPKMRLGQAIPNDSVSLTPEDFTVINESCLTSQQKQSISLGTIFADSKAVQKFAAMSPEEQELIVDILDDPEIDDLGDAIITLKNGFGKGVPEQGRKIEKARTAVEKAFDKLVSTLDDLQSLHPNHSCYMACLESVKATREVWQTWR